MARASQPLENAVPIRVFGVLQAILLVVIVASIIMFRRKQQQRGTGASVDNVDLRAAIHRAKAFHAQESTQRQREFARKAQTASAKAESEGERSPAQSQRPQIESALPAWGPDTPPHEILGVSPSADRKTVEAAYKRQLKRYHPDRFASWGKGHQTRAHHVVLLLQKARDRMLSS